RCDWFWQVRRRGLGGQHRGANSVYGAAPVAGRAVAAVAARDESEWPVMVIVAHAAQRQAGADPQRFETAMPRSMPAPRAIRAVRSEERRVGKECRSRWS